MKQDPNIWLFYLGHGLTIIGCIGIVILATIKLIKIIKNENN